MNRRTGIVVCISIALLAGALLIVQGWSAPFPGWVDFVLYGSLGISGAGLLFWTSRRRQAESLTAAFLGAAGPRRCLLAPALLRRLASDPADARQRAWDRIEIPLLQAIPDCPPALKGELVDALDGLAKVSTNRSLAKRINDLRNSVLT